MFRGTERVAVPRSTAASSSVNGGQNNAFTPERLHDVLRQHRQRSHAGRARARRRPHENSLVINEAHRFAARPRRRCFGKNAACTHRRQPDGGALRADSPPRPSSAHPYQQPIIGWMSDIARSTADDLLHHYKTYYVREQCIHRRRPRGLRFGEAPRRRAPAYVRRRAEPDRCRRPSAAWSRSSQGERAGSKVAFARPSFPTS